MLHSICHIHLTLSLPQSFTLLTSVCLCVVCAFARSFICVCVLLFFPLSVIITTMFHVLFSVNIVNTSHRLEWMHLIPLYRWIYSMATLCIKKNSVCDIFMRVHVRACCCWYISVCLWKYYVRVCVCLRVCQFKWKNHCRFYLDVVRRLERRVLAVVAATAAAAAVSLPFRFFLQ